jgi:Rad3-related DNA helicase
MHKTDSGIIHTANFKIAEWLVENLDVPQKIYHHNPDSGDDRNSIIEAFQDSPKPGLLISPSITEGLDLKDDLSRFAIIAKTPFPYMGDQWVKARQELSTEWYRRQALIDVIQGCGRIVRSKDDYGNVYIIDESWAYLYSQSQNAIPQWWKDSYRVME